MDNLRIALLQTALIWESPEQNRNSIGQALGELDTGEADLIVLPEMFTTGFTMNVSNLAETPDGPTLAWIKKQAQKLDSAITGSWIVRSERKYYNRLHWVTPDGSVEHYDKRHLFRMAGEDEVFSSGAKKLIVSWKGWRICPLICYDLRFPVWSRAKQNYDLLIYVANWPEARRNAWITLGQARAIENLSPVVAVNRVGVDGNGISYSGDSAIYDAKGMQVSSLDPKEEGLDVVELSGAKLLRYREKFPAHRDADEFTLGE